jgi:hypothetical protein
MNPGQLQGTDLVFVHPKRRTVHEARDPSHLSCGNSGGSSTGYLPMTRSQAQGMAGTKPCKSLACEAARR